MSAVNQLGKYQPYPAYQKSEAEWIGQLPSEWNLKRGKYVFHEINERSESGDEQLLSVSEYYGVKPRQDVAEEGEFLSRAESLVGYKKCQVDDLAMNIMLAWKTGLGVSEYEGIISPAYAVFRFYLSVAVPAYMHYLLRTEMYSGHFKTLSTGVIDSRLRLYPETFSTIEIVLPSVEEQRSIAAFLDYETARIDRLIAQQQRLIELLKEKRQAVISHAVTKGLNPDVPMKDSGVEWLGQVPKHWVVCKIKNLAAVISKGTTPSTIGAEFIDEGVRFLKAENIGKSNIVSIDPEFFISEDVDRQISRSQLKENDVLVIIAGATTGFASVLQKELLPANTNQAVSFIRLLEPLHSKWVLYWLSTTPVQKTIWMGAVQAAQPNLSMENLGNIPIVIPPINEIAAHLKYIENKIVNFDNLAEKAGMAIQLMQERRTALISAAVTGKIDLRGWTQPAEEVAA
ncbi:restriction endonuclease subunit S [Aeromonas veronii]